METKYRQVDWHWTEWHGPYNRVEQSKIIDVPYHRYPRDFIEPPSIELTFTENNSGHQLLTSSTVENNPNNHKLLTHIVNLFLEIFGEAQFFTDNLDAIIKTPIKRVNWEILPKGELPWERLKTLLNPVLRQARGGNRPVIEYRLETVNRMGPEFIVLGHGGFHGYLIHAFPKKGIFVLENMLYGNATYVFGEAWEKLSQMTKAEILNDNLQKARVIHREGWEEKIKEILKKSGGE